MITFLIKIGADAGWSPHSGVKRGVSLASKVAGDQRCQLDVALQGR